MGGPGGSGGVRLVINQAMVQETHVSLGSAGAEQQMGAVMTNVVPKQGGNTFSGMTYFHYTNESFSGDNIPAELKATNFSAAGQIRESWKLTRRSAVPSFATGCGSTVRIVTGAMRWTAGSTTTLRPPPGHTRRT